MKISKQARRDAKAFFRLSMVNGVMSEQKVRDIVRQILAAKPRGYVGILEHFKRLVKLELDRRRAEVESAVPMTPEQQAGVKTSLERLYGPGLDIQFRQKPELVGGLRVRVGSDVYDGSLQARLEELEESFSL